MMRPKAEVPVGISPRKCCNYDMGHVIILAISVKLGRERERERERENTHLKLIPLVKQEDKIQRVPKPNQRLDLATSLHIIKSVISCPIRSRLPPSSSSVSNCTNHI
jgi:hypothetical protein